MTLLQDLARLRPFIDGASALTVLVASEPSQPAHQDGIVFQRLRMARALAAEFRRVALAGLPRGDDEVVLKPYDPGYRPDPHELCHMRISDVPAIDEVVRGVSQVDSAELFREDSEVIAGLRFYAVVVQGSGDGPAILFRSYAPAGELTRSAKFGIILRNGFYDKVETKVFLLDDRLDCFAWRGQMFIRSIPQFHRIFGYFEALIERAEETFAVIAPRIPISNFSEFKEACKNNVLMLAKLSQIAEKPYLSTVTMSDIKRTIEEFDLRVPVVTDGGVEKLVFEKSLEKRWTILKLLDDDYLGSVMTHLKYVANSKLAVS